MELSFRNLDFLWLLFFKVYIVLLFITSRSTTAAVPISSASFKASYRISLVNFTFFFARSP